MTALLRLDDVDFDYGQDTHVLSRFSLDVADGEFIALLGPSGCGKTTILNLAAGLIRCSGGSVVFDGVRLEGINTRVGYMTQGDTLLPWQTVAANLALPLEIRGLPRGEIRSRIDGYLTLIGLSGKGHLYPAQLSGGMKRRALLARSLIYEPRMLLMDEPFAALDAQLRETLQKELLRIVARLGRGVLLVTHDISESILLADRILVLGRQPAQVMAEVRPSFGRERDLEKVRLSPEYSDLEREIRESLREAVPN